MRRLFKAALFIFGLAFITAYMVSFLYVFEGAYYDGVISGKYQAIVDINSIGEANGELVLFFIFGIPITFYIIFDYCRYWIHDFYEQ